MDPTLRLVILSDRTVGSALVVVIHSLWVYIHIDTYIYILRWEGGGGVEI